MALRKLPRAQAEPSQGGASRLPLEHRSAAFGADVSVTNAAARLVAGALGPIAILVNNAGVAFRRELYDLTEADLALARSARPATPIRRALKYSH